MSENAAQLAADGLRFRASNVDVVHAARAATSLDGTDPFDLVMVAVKAPALEAIIPTLAPVIDNSRLDQTLNTPALVTLRPLNS